MSCVVNWGRCGHLECQLSAESSYRTALFIFFKMSKFVPVRTFGDRGCGCLLFSSFRSLGAIYCFKRGSRFCVKLEQW